MSEGCSLLTGTFGVIVQGLLLAVLAVVLALKKNHEDMVMRLEARSWPTFLLDSSKQFTGTGWAHVVGLLCTASLGSHFVGNGCDLYLSTLLLDATLGICIEFLLLRLFTQVFESVPGQKGLLQTGNYKDEAGRFAPVRYLRQLAVWLLCVTVTKLVLMFLLVNWHGSLNQVVHSLLGVFPEDSELEVVIVTVIMPCFLNAVQFWLTDDFIKREGPIKFVADAPENSDFEMCETH